MRIVTWTGRTLAARLLLVPALLAVSALPAYADITAFIGLSPTPERHTVRGFSGGLSLVIVGFEFEYSNLDEDEAQALPGLKTYSGNVHVQTPVEIVGTQFYGTIGAGGYQERQGGHEETQFGTNFGGGAKIRVIGPVRVRLDYRVFKLQGDALYATYQRFYVGANIAF